MIITLSTGKEFYANKGIIGIDPNGAIYECYDGIIYDELTQDERRELANLMIERWIKFAHLTDEEYKISYL